MKHLICPPCGTPIAAESDEELIAATQGHARDHHDYLPSADEVLSMAHDGPAPAQRDAS